MKSVSTKGLQANYSLRDCPFCGGEAVVCGYPDEFMVYVKCSKCGAMSGRVEATEEKAAENWNRRFERTCRWVWIESWSDNELGRECDYANWALDCGCWDGWDRELHDFDDYYEPPREWGYCPRCGAKVVGE